MYARREVRRRTDGGISDVAEKPGVHPENVRAWFRRHEIDHGRWPGLCIDDRTCIAELEAGERELRRANLNLVDL